MNGLLGRKYVERNIFYVENLNSEQRNLKDYCYNKSTKSVVARIKGCHLTAISERMKH